MNSWKEFIALESTKDYYTKLKQIVDADYEKDTIYPPKEYIFNAFKYCPLDKVKVVILGQDPYHGQGQAHGLSFSVNKGIALPPSLRNIYGELQTDVNFSNPGHGDLTDWAKQGVLLLNDVLTVKAGQPASHQKLGWEQFTQNVISFLSNEKSGLVFMLWGNHAQKKGKNIDRSKHLVLTSGHPSPMSANQGKWFGNKHFSQANNFLLQQEKQPINWQLSF
ncbi:uracil-DNA glycosylase [Flavobacterium sp. CBA20B-1]|uniref:uracil-DNA glycosylase n=1 Tax=unclassified Flavobacterium TaxID=196869 RepID=UPI00222570EA|nr:MULTISPECIES: uracil-DNA glycosylase [unclassified Flavobacterium]WCM42772.1 uracil-DNA glycosylase [Flavobacterium sp. CBA20B-1]